MVILHDKHTIDTIDWDKKRDGIYVRDYFTPILEHGVNAYIENVETNVFLLEIDDLILPITVNEKEFDNSYVCSPYTHYISYAKEELWELKMPKAEKLLSKVIDGIGFLLRQTSVNRIVSVNNWFLSTNLYFPLSDSQIQRITTFLTKKFPSHTILFRSLNRTLHNDMFNGFFHNNYESIMSRAIYIFDPERFRSLNHKQKKDFKRDENLMKKSDYELVQPTDVTESLIPIIKSLYNELYIEKYSEHNPQFTIEYFKNALNKQLLSFKLLKNEHSYDGVIGYFHRNNVLTTPILGYDMENGQKNGLYRLLSLLIANEVIEKNYTGHFSAGAGDFKRNRGSVQEIEYSFLYNKHLPLKSKIVWKFLKGLMDNIVEPMARKLKF